tara:strand:- start:163 stop:561 length:399 start_codon:yes stop_codon:yes gene_type:complete
MTYPDNNIEFGQSPSVVAVDYMGDGVYAALEPIPYSDNAAVVYESQSVNEILQWVNSNYDMNTELQVSDMAKMTSQNETNELITKIDKHLGDSKEQLENLEENIGTAIETFLNCILSELNKGETGDNDTEES